MKKRIVSALLAVVMTASLFSAAFSAVSAAGETGDRTDTVTGLDELAEAVIRLYVEGPDESAGYYIHTGTSEGTWSCPPGEWNRNVTLADHLEAAGMVKNARDTVRDGKVTAEGLACSKTRFWSERLGREDLNRGFFFSDGALSSKGTSAGAEIAAYEDAVIHAANVYLFVSSFSNEKVLGLADGYTVAGLNRMVRDEIKAVEGEFRRLSGLIDAGDLPPDYAAAVRNAAGLFDPDLYMDGIGMKVSAGAPGDGDIWTSAYGAAVGGSELWVDYDTLYERYTEPFFRFLTEYRKAEGNGGLNGMPGSGTAYLDWSADTGLYDSYTELCSAVIEDFIGSYGIRPGLSEAGVCRTSEAQVRSALSEYFRLEGLYGVYASYMADAYGTLYSSSTPEKELVATAAAVRGILSAADPRSDGNRNWTVTVYLEDIIGEYYDRLSQAIGAVAPNSFFGMTVSDVSLLARQISLTDHYSDAFGDVLTGPDGAQSVELREALDAQRNARFLLDVTDAAENGSVSVSAGFGGEKVCFTDGYGFLGEMNVVTDRCSVEFYPHYTVFSRLFEDLSGANERLVTEALKRDALHRGTQESGTVFVPGTDTVISGGRGNTGADATELAEWLTLAGPLCGTVGRTYRFENGEIKCVTDRAAEAVNAGGCYDVMALYGELYGYDPSYPDYPEMNDPRENCGDLIACYASACALADENRILTDMDASAAADFTLRAGLAVSGIKSCIRYITVALEDIQWLTDVRAQGMMTLLHARMSDGKIEFENGALVEKMFGKESAGAVRDALNRLYAAKGAYIRTQTSSVRSGDPSGYSLIETGISTRRGITDAYNEAENAFRMLLTPDGLQRWELYSGAVDEFFYGYGMGAGTGDTVSVLTYLGPYDLNPVYQTWNVLFRYLVEDYIPSDIYYGAGYRDRLESIYGEMLDTSGNYTLTYVEKLSDGAELVRALVSCYSVDAGGKVTFGNGDLTFGNVTDIMDRVLSVYGERAGHTVGAVAEYRNGSGFDGLVSRAENFSIYPGFGKEFGSALAEAAVLQHNPRCEKEDIDRVMSRISDIMKASETVTGFEEAVKESVRVLDLSVSSGAGSDGDREELEALVRKMRTVISEYAPDGNAECPEEYAALTAATGLLLSGIRKASAEYKEQSGLEKTVEEAKLRTVNGRLITALDGAVAFAEAVLADPEAGTGDVDKAAGGLLEVFETDGLLISYANAIERAGALVSSADVYGSTKDGYLALQELKTKADDLRGSLGDESIPFEAVAAAFEGLVLACDAAEKQMITGESTRVIADGIFSARSEDGYTNHSWSVFGNAYAALCSFCEEEGHRESEYARRLQTLKDAESALRRADNGSAPADGGAARETDGFCDAARSVHSELVSRYRDTDMSLYTPDSVNRLANAINALGTLIDKKASDGSVLDAVVNARLAFSALEKREAETNPGTSDD